MKQYEKYKDSGIQWLGEVPNHWGINPFKRGMLINNGKDYKHIETLEGYPVIGSGGQFAYASEYLYDGEAVLLGRKGTIGKPKYINGKFWTVDTMFYAIPQKQISTRYMYYQALIFPFGLYQTDTAVPSMTQTDLGNNPVCYPPLSEQLTIAAYLDYKVGQIDAAIKEKEAMLEDLKAYRTAIISEAVTKGLDKGVTFVESGNEAIGNIPLGWKVMKTLYCLSMPITDGPHTTPELLDEGIPFISAEAVSCGNGKIDFTHKRGYISQDFYEECCNKYIPQRNDIYMIKSGATTGKVAIVDTDEIFTIWSPLAVFRCDIEVMLPSYMFYLLQSTLYQSQVELGWSFGTQQNIGMRVLEKIPVPVPPIEEQQSIVEHITNKIYKLDKAIGELSQSSNDLQSYKSSVISEAVTGKVDLRNWNKKTVTA